MKYLFPLFFTALLTIHSNAQVVNEDSLKAIISRNQKDTLEVDALNSLGRYLLLHKLDSAGGFDHLNKAEHLAKNLGYHQGIVQSWLLKGNHFRKISAWAESMEMFKKILSYPFPTDKTGIYARAKMMAYNNMAGIYNINGDYPTALENRLNGLQIAETLFSKDTPALMITNLNVASDYNQLQIMSKAKEYLKKGGLLLAGAPPNLQFEYWYESHSIAEKDGNIKEMEEALNGIENILNTASLSPYQKQDFGQEYYKLYGKHQRENKKDYGAAITANKEQLRIAREMEEEKNILAAKYQLGLSYYKAGNISMAVPLFTEVFEAGEATGIMENVFNAGHFLSKIFELKGDNKKALYYLNQATQMEDSILNQEKIQQLNFLEAKYQGEKKTKEIDGLKLANSEKEIAVLQKSRWLTGVASGSGMLILLLGGLYRNSKQKQTIAQHENNLNREQIKFYQKQQQVISLQSMINGQETERTRVAKDLHDSLGGTFSTLKMFLGSLERDKPELSDNPVFRKSYDFINQAAEDVRRIAHNMMPEVLMKLGLLDAVQDLCTNINTGKLLHVTLQAYGMEKRLAASTEIMLYRIIQELLNNIIKHSKATEAIVQFNRLDDKLTVTIEDNGTGFVSIHDDSGIHAGLDSVKSRVNCLNGNIHIESEKDNGTTVLMEFLLDEET